MKIIYNTSFLRSLNVAPEHPGTAFIQFLHFKQILWKSNMVHSYMFMYNCIVTLFFYHRIVDLLSIVYYL